MGENVLVPYDGSTPAKEALAYALERLPDADVTVLYVVEVPETYWSALGGDPDRVPGHETAVERGEELLEEAAERAADVGRGVDTVLETGEPHRVIVERTEDGAFDSVVIGSHGREGLSRVVVGSVAEKVVRRAPIPVVVVR